MPTFLIAKLFTFKFLPTILENQWLKKIPKFKMEVGEEEGQEAEEKGKKGFLLLPHSQAGGMKGQASEPTRREFSSPLSVKRRTGI